MSQQITEVVFRKFKDQKDIIALFPYEVETYAGAVNSYMHIGQHGSADYTMCIRASEAAIPEDYDSLKIELENIGYQLKVVKRRQLNRYIQAWKNIYHSSISKQ